MSDKSEDIVRAYYHLIESSTPTKQDAIRSAVALLDVKARRARLEELEELVGGLTDVIIESAKQPVKTARAIRYLAVIRIAELVLILVVLLKI